MANLTNSQLQTLINTSLADNETGEISALDLRGVTDALLHSIGGWQVRANSNTTPQTILADTSTIVTNDHSVGTFENKPVYLTGDMLIANRISLAELTEGSVLHLRAHLDVTTTAANTVFHLTGKAYNAGGTLIETIEFDSHYFKSAGTYSITSHLMTFVVSLSAGGYTELEMNSDANVDVLWKNTIVRVGL